MTLADFRTLVQNSIKRGAIPVDDYIRRAVRFIELNYTLNYMVGIASPYTLAGGLASFNYSSWGNIKSILAIRAFFGDGTFKNLNKISFEDIERLSTYQGEYPSQFWVDAPTTTVFLNGTTTESASLLVKRAVFTPALVDGLWLFDNGEGALLGRALVEAGIGLKAPDLIQFGQAEFDAWIKVLLNADFEARYAGQDIRQ